MFKKAHQLWIVRCAEELCDRVSCLIDGWSRSERRHLANQLIRPADSIGANLAEGYARQTPSDSLHFYYIPRGSLEETIYWLRRALARGVGDDREERKIVERYILLSKSLDKFISYHQSTK